MLIEIRKHIRFVIIVVMQYILGIHLQDLVVFMGHIFNVLIVLGWIILKLSCGQSNKSIGQKTFWKYCGGNHIGDILVLDKTDTGNSGDTIYRGKTALAIIERIENRLTDKVLIVRTIPENNEGRYCEK